MIWFFTLCILRTVHLIAFCSFKLISSKCKILRDILSPKRHLSLIYVPIFLRKSKTNFTKSKWTWAPRVQGWHRGNKHHETLKHSGLQFLFKKFIYLHIISTLQNFSSPLESHIPYSSLTQIMNGDPFPRKQVVTCYKPLIDLDLDPNFILLKFSVSGTGHDFFKILSWSRFWCMVFSYLHDRFWTCLLPIWIRAPPWAAFYQQTPHSHRRSSIWGLLCPKALLLSYIRNTGCPVCHSPLSLALWF